MSIHTHYSDNVIYFQKYNFKLEHKDITEAKHWIVPMEQLVAIAVCAWDINDKQYVKVNRPDFDWETQTYTRLANKEIMMGIFAYYQDIVEPQHRELAKEIIAEIMLDNQMKIMADTMSDFDTSVTKILSQKACSVSDFGFVAYLPELYQREKAKRIMRDRSDNSKPIASVGSKIKRTIEILKFNESQNFPGFNVQAITDKDERISFFTSNAQIPSILGQFEIEAKVKSHEKVWNTNIDSTRLNYVKLT